MSLLSLGSKPAGLADSAIEALVLRYGDLVFDLCQTLLQSPQNAQVILRDVFVQVRKSRPNERFERHERAWVLSIACAKVRETALAHAPQLSANEQIELDSASDPTVRLGKFSVCLRRLAVDDQILLLLKDKYGLPMREIAAVLGRSEESLKVQRAQALRSLEDWVWEAT